MLVLVLVLESITSYFMKQNQNLKESISIPPAAFSGQYSLWEACMHKIPWRFVLYVCVGGVGLGIVCLLSWNNHKTKM